MSCGHCQVHVKAELEANDFKVLEIDMNENSVRIDTSSTNIHKIKAILDNINYMIDNQTPIVDILEYTIWDDKLDDEAVYETFSSYLSDKKISMIGFNDENFGVIILCTKIQYKNVVEYINEL